MAATALSAGESAATSSFQSLSQEQFLYDSASNLEKVENKIRAHVYAARVRIEDFFKDFDKLRTGYVTSSQFRRCINLAVQVKVGFATLSQDDIDVLIAHYDDRHDGNFNYARFADSIDQVFTVKRLEANPSLIPPASHEILRDVKPPLSPAAEEALESAMDRVRAYTEYHGSRAKSWFRDFDRHNSGFVTFNQFRRGFPINLLSAEEVELAVSKYGDEATQTVNYFKFNVELDKKAAPHYIYGRKTPPPQPFGIQPLPAVAPAEDRHAVPIGTERVLLRNSKGLGSIIRGAGGPAKESAQSLDEIVASIQKEIFTLRIRLVEFFRDYDKHNWGVITEHQFRAGLKTSQLELSEAAIKKIVESYQTDDGRVQYRRFCEELDKIFTEKELEKNPTKVVAPPARDFLVKDSNDLDPEMEAHVAEILDNIRLQKNSKRLILSTFFKDFDAGKGHTGRITKSQFSRLIGNIGLNISDFDIRVLMAKFADDSSGDVHYSAFIRSLALEEESEKKKVASSDNYSNSGANSDPETIKKDTDYLMEQIRNHVWTKRIRVIEFFKDFDKLRTGRIGRQEFIRCLSRVGYALTEQGLKLISDRYAIEQAEGQGKGGLGECDWTAFCEDVDTVFGKKHLETTPSLKPNQVVSSRSIVQPVSTLSSAKSELLHRILAAFRQICVTRRLQLKPPFHDFDRLGTGRITQSQFHQCLSYLKFLLDDNEFEVLATHFGGPNGEDVRYLEFIRTVEEEPDKPATKVATSVPNQKSPGSINASISNMVETTGVTGNHTLSTSIDIDSLLHKMRAKVKTERIRAQEFLHDYDPLRKGRIPKADFRRAVKTMGFSLTEKEFELLEQKYPPIHEKEPHHHVQYTAFCDDMEAVFTIKELEKDPTRTLPSFEEDSLAPGAVPVHSIKDSLNSIEKECLERCMRRLAEKVRHRRMDILTYFEDFDKIHNGTVSPSQFRSVLTNVGLSLTDFEFKLLIDVHVSSSNPHAVDYLRFNTSLMDLVMKGRQMGGVQ